MIKDSLHQLVEELPDEELSTAFKFLQYLKDVSAEQYVETVMSNQDDLEAIDDVLETEEETETSVADAWQQYLDSKARPWAPMKDDY